MAESKRIKHCPHSAFEPFTADISILVAGADVWLAVNL